MLKRVISFFSRCWIVSCYDEYNRITKYNISNNIIRAHGIFLKSLMVTSRWSVQPYLNVQNIFGLVGTLMGNGRHWVQQQSIGLVNPWTRAIFYRKLSKNVKHRHIQTRLWRLSLGRPLCWGLEPAKMIFHPGSQAEIFCISLSTQKF